MRTQSASRDFAPTPAGSRSASAVARGSVVRTLLGGWGRTVAGDVFFAFFTAVVLIQGIHVFEHVVQLAQVYALGVSEDEALGLLGYVLQLQGTAEWLHLGFNSTYLLALYLLVLPLSRLRGIDVPNWAFAVFIAGVALESWHVVEHGVIISNVITNHGCPCPGIVDAATGLSDTVLHFVYNALAYTAMVVPFWFLARSRVVRPRRPG